MKTKAERTFTGSPSCRRHTREQERPEQKTNARQQQTTSRRRQAAAADRRRPVPHRPIKPAARGRHPAKKPERGPGIIFPRGSRICPARLFALLCAAQLARCETLSRAHLASALRGQRANRLAPLRRLTRKRRRRSQWPRFAPSTRTPPRRRARRGGEPAADEKKHNEHRPASWESKVKCLRCTRVSSRRCPKGQSETSSSRARG